MSVEEGLCARESPFRIVFKVNELGLQHLAYTGSWIIGSSALSQQDT